MIKAQEIALMLLSTCKLAGGQSGQAGDDSVISNKSRKKTKVNSRDASKDAGECK